MTEAGTDAVMAGLEQRVRERLRTQMLQSGGPEAFADPDIFSAVNTLLRSAVEAGPATELLLTEMLGDPATWRLQTGIRYQSHRGPLQATLRLFLKRRVLTPMFRWLFDYSRENFERQRHVNLVLFACVLELAAETARLRQQVPPQPPAVGAGDARPR